MVPIWPQSASAKSLGSTLRLDSKTQEAYDIAEIAKSKGLDFSTEIEIPRASDLASRTEKLLEEYLKGLEIEEGLREILLNLQL